MTNLRLAGFPDDSDPRPRPALAVGVYDGNTGNPVAATVRWILPDGTLNTTMPTPWDGVCWT